MSLPVFLVLSSQHPANHGQPKFTYYLTFLLIQGETVFISVTNGSWLNVAEGNSCCFVGADNKQNNLWEYATALLLKCVEYT
jgi:hypothetical protein